jgi:CopG family nickel-responsive transcriptional regulator
MSAKIERFTISLDEELAQQFEALTQLRGYTNRSEAIRDLLRTDLAEVHLDHKGDHSGVGVLVYVYDHQERELARRLTHLQHGEHAMIQATLHIHLDQQRCLEAVVLHGVVDHMRHFAHHLMSEPGVQHGKLHLVPFESIAA